MALPFPALQVPVESRHHQGEEGQSVADLLADAELMHAARADAQQMLAADPQLLRRPTLRTEVERALGDDAHYLRRS